MDYAATILARIAKNGCWEVCHSLLESSATIAELARKTDMSIQAVQAAVRELHAAGLVSRLGNKNSTIVISQPEYFLDLLDSAHALAVEISSDRAKSSRLRAEDFRKKTKHWGVDLESGDQDQ